MSTTILDFIKNRWKLWLFAVFSLGITPVYPEPHLLEKARWLATGSIHLAPTDWFDFFFHLVPWCLAGCSALLHMLDRYRKPNLTEN